MPAASPRASASRNSSNGVRPVTCVSRNAASALPRSTKIRSSSAPGCCAECVPVAAGKLSVRADQPRRAVRADAHFAPVEQGPEILRPKRVLRAVPAEPAVEPQVEQAERVAVHGLLSSALRQPVGPGPVRRGGRLRRRPCRRSTGADRRTAPGRRRCQPACRKPGCSDRAPGPAATARGAGSGAFPRQ